MQEAFICDALRTPIRALRRRALERAPRRPGRDPAEGAHGAQSGRRLGGGRRRHLRLREPGGRGQPQRRAAWRCCSPDCRSEVPGTTVNRLCGSSLDAIGIAARAIKSGETALMIAGGVESMSRAPFVMGKADCRVLARREDRGHDHRLAFRQSADEGEVRRRLDARDGGERRGGFQGVARRPGCVRVAQPAARRRGHRAGRLAEEIVPVTIAQKKGDPVVVHAGRASARDDARSARPS